MQVTGKVPTVTIDGTDGGQLYLGRESLDVEIVTAKSSSVNISLPVEGEEEGIFAEKPVPEQLKTVIRCICPRSDGEGSTDARAQRREAGDDGGGAQRMRDETDEMQTTP